MFLRIHIDLTPVVWTHTLSHDGATVLRAQAKCAPGGRCDLRLRNGAKIADYELALTILNGEITASDRQKYALVEEANGGLWFVDDEHADELIHGWFFGTGSYVDAALPIRLWSNRGPFNKSQTNQT